MEYVIGFIFSLLLNLTWGLSTGNTTRSIPGVVYFHGVNLFLSAFSILAWTILIAGLLEVTQIVISKIDFEKVNKYCHFNKIQIAVILMCSWLIELIIFLPGQISWDAAKQFCEFEAKYVSAASFTYFPTNHNPWFVTLFFGHVFNIGNKIVGPNLGVFLIIVVQLIISCLIYSSCINYLFKKNGSFFAISALMMIASPVIGTYISTVDKSTLYYAFCVWLFVEYLKLFDNNGIHNNYKQVISYSVASILFSFFRNDSIYIVVLSTIIYILYAVIKRHNVLSPILSILIVIIVFGGWHGYLSQKQVVPSAISEAITLPTRQISYVYLHNSKNLSRSDKEIINQITPLKMINKNMNINQGDDLKNLFPVNTFLNSTYLMKQVTEGHKTSKLTLKERKQVNEYIRLWIKLGISHPKDYINVFLVANKFWINPFLPQSVPTYALFINYPDKLSNFVEPDWASGYHYLLPLTIRNQTISLIYLLLAFPPLAVLINVAMPFMMVLFSLYVIVRNKKVELFIKMIPFYGLVALLFLVPAPGYSRYSIGVSLLIPFVLFALYDCDYHQFIKKEGTRNWIR